MFRDSWFPVPTLRLALLAVAASLLVAVLPLPSIWPLVAVNALLLAFAVVDWMLAPKPSTLTVERNFAPVVPLEAEDEIVWKVSNPTPRRLLVALADGIPPSFRAEHRSVDLAIPAHGTVQAATTFKPSRRGNFTIGMLVLRIQGPMRLTARQAKRWQPSEIKVYPPFRSRKEAELRIEKARILEVGLRSAQGHGGGTEFEQLREYGPDDDFRRIDWSATARFNKAVVRTFRAEKNQQVSLLLDTGRVMAGRVQDVSRIEHAMDAVMTLATVAARLGDRVSMLAFSNAVEAEVAAGHGSSQVARITEAMYQLEPRLVESDYRGAFVHALSRHRRRSLVVVLTDLSGPGISDTLRPALPLMLRNHFVIVASIADPDVSSWAADIPIEANKAYRKAAAISALNDRRRTKTALSRMGATVVDAVPGLISTQLADAYLNIKATGRL